MKLHYIRHTHTFVYRNTTRRVHVYTCRVKLIVYVVTHSLLQLCAIFDGNSCKTFKVTGIKLIVLPFLWTCCTYIKVPTADVLIVAYVKLM